MSEFQANPNPAFEDGAVSGSNNIDAEKTSSPASYVIPELTAEEKDVDRSIVRKIDLMIIPLCALNYFFSGMDRSDIGNAKVAGFQTDNHLSNAQFSTIVSLYYLGYIVFQPVGTGVFKFVETYLVLGLANMAWGIMTVLLLLSTGIVLPAIFRVFIGAAQSLTNINNIFLTLWYTQDEIAFRTGLLYSAGVLAGSFNGIIAYGIQEHDTSTLNHWQLLFLVEGLFPIAFGPILLCFYPSSPQRAKKFFTEKERSLCIARTRRARNTAGETITWTSMLTIFANPETYAFWIIYFCVQWAISGYSNFLPSIVNGLGFSPANSQLLTVPIVFLGFLSVNLWCWISDKTQYRGPLMIGLALLALTGFAILAGVAKGQGARIFALCLISFSVQPLAPLSLAFLFVNTVGLSRRSFGIPLQNAVGQFGGLAVSYTYTGPPRYFKGTIATVGLLAALVITVALLDVYFLQQNRKKVALQGTEQFEEDRKESFDTLGTRHPEFTFTI